MMFKRMLLVICLFVCLFSMASVCASDTNDTAMATTDIMELPQNEKLLTDDLRITEGDSSLSQTNDEGLISQTKDNGTFSDLQSKINAAEEEGTINLMNDYTFNGSDKEISITKAITINGNGFTINALEKSRIFNIESSGHIVLNNITFINGKSDLGGAILFGNNVSDIVIDNCKFINNSATFNGGVLYANATFINSTIANTEFENNVATKNGGAIYFKGQSSGILFENLTFENNVAQYGDSGAINFYGKMSDITFDNVVFYNNSAKRMGSASSMGGAINIDKGVENCLFNNTLFVQNFAKNSAGALSINKAISALTFENTNFINNTADLEDGGAIHVGTWSRSNLVGATFKNVVFDGNTANNGGGALFVTGETSSNVFEDVKFINNVAKTVNGGAMCLGTGKDTNAIVGNRFENVTFEDNTANNTGGALYLRGASSSNEFKDVKFINNVAKTVNGGAMCLGTDRNTDTIVGNRFENVTFEDNVAFKNGGALYFRGASSSNEFKDVNFISNVAQCGDSGAVNFNGKISNATFDNVVFFNNSAKRMGPATTHSMGGAINIDYGVENCLFNNTLFVQNFAKNSAGALSINRAISGLTFENTNFINNTAELDDGGAIHVGTWVRSNLVGATFKNVVFAGNTANNTGGALFVTGKTLSNVFEDVKFINNVAKTVNGGAMCLGTDRDADTIVGNRFENVTFEDNVAFKNGGALYFRGASSSNEFKDVNFISNVAQCGDSGAVNFNGKISNATFDNVVFFNNSAKRMGPATTHSMGGAINIDYGVENCLFNNTLFVQNFAKNSAGALSINRAISGLTFENTRFIRNTAELDDGGAIHVGTWVRSNLVGATFKNVVFAGNAANSGGALFVTGETSLNVFEDVKFIKNVAKKANGGAITLGANKNLNSTNNTFENVVFAGNTANNTGGAVFVTGKSSLDNFKNCNFINNTAEDGGAIYFLEVNCDLIENAIFINNGKNTIYVVSGENITAVSSWFGNNATDYNIKAEAGNVTMDNWLFLNATADADVISAFNSSNIVFKLYLYNASSANISEYDNSILMPVNLTITSTNGYVDNAVVNLGDSIRYTATGVGEGSVTATIENVECTIGLNNIKANPDLSAIGQVIVYGENATIAIKYHPNATGNVNITLTGKKATLTYLNMDLNATIILPNDIPADEYDVTVVYPGDANFLNGTANATLAVNKANSTLTVNGNVSFDYNNKGFTTVNFTNATGVVAEVIGKPSATVVVENDTITVSGLDAGNYVLSVTTITDGNHNNVSEAVNVTVNKAKTVLTAKTVNAVYNVNKNLVITLKDSTGKAVSGVKITVKLKGTKTYTTDKKGQVKINVAKLVPKKYTAKVTFAGNSNYLKSTANVKVTVKKAKAKIKAKKKTYKAKKKTKKFKITLKDNKGKPIKKAKVRLIVKKTAKKTKSKNKKKKNIAKTNKKGKATFKINRNKKGTYVATVKFYGNKYYKKAVKKVKIKMK